MVAEPENGVPGAGVLAHFVRVAVQPVDERGGRKLAVAVFADELFKGGGKEAAPFRVSRQHLCRMRGGGDVDGQPG